VIRIRAYARRRMAERGVTEEDIRWALRRPQRTAAGSPGTIWVYGYARGRLLKVNVNADDQEYVRTVAWADE
jgi:hypothetical protein